MGIPIFIQYQICIFGPLLLGCALIFSYYYQLMVLELGDWYDAHALSLLHINSYARPFTSPQ